MAEGYILDECLGFVTKYLQSFKVVQWCVWDANEEEVDVGEVCSRCLDQICDESNLKGPSPPICANQHIDYDTLDGVTMMLQTFSLELEHDFIFIWCSNVFLTFQFFEIPYDNPLIYGFCY